MAVVAKADASPRLRAIQDLHDALGLVTTNGQAVAAADLVIGALTQGRDQFASSLNFIPLVFVLNQLAVDRRDAFSRLDEARNDVLRAREPMAGNFDQLVQLDSSGRPAGSWDDLYHAIQRGYGQLWAVQDVQGDSSEWQATVSALGDIAIGTVQAMPGVIQAALHFTAELATDTVGSVAKGLLPLWPLVVVGGLVVVVGLVVLAAGRKKGLLA